MTIKKQPFRSYTTDESQKIDTFTIRLNERERVELEEAKVVLNQTKDGTALKQLAELGKIVLHKGSTNKIIEVLFKNKRRNKDRGVIDFD